MRLTILGNEWKPAEGKQKVYTHRVEKSKSSRATCRRCSEKIEKGAIRIGTPIKWRGGEWGWISSWSHVQCTRVEADLELDAATFDASASIFGFEKMEEVEQKAITEEMGKLGLPDHIPKIDPTDKNFLKNFKLVKMPKPKVVTLPLLPYQAEGLGWLLNQERSKWRGGILADGT